MQFISDIHILYLRIWRTSPFRRQQFGVVNAFDQSHLSFVHNRCQLSHHFPYWQWLSSKSASVLKRSQIQVHFHISSMNKPLRLYHDTKNSLAYYYGNSHVIMTSWYRSFVRFSLCGKHELVHQLLLFGVDGPSFNF